MRIGVLGAGAMGMLIGGILSKANDVTLIDVNAQAVNKINRDGVVIREKDGTLQTVRPAAVVNTQAMEPVDLLILFVKSMHNRSALQANQSVIGPHTFVMTLQNGSGHETVLQEFVDKERVVIGTTQHNSSIIESGHINHGGSGHTYIGGLTGHPEALQPIADAFQAAGLEASIQHNVQKLIWDKMFTNVSASVLTAALQCPLGYVAENPNAWKLCKMLVREAVEVANGEGLDFHYEEKLKEVQAVCANAPNGYTSIYADLRDGRKSEVDAISGSVVRASRRNGIPAPLHEFVVNLIHAMESNQQP